MLFSDSDDELVDDLLLGIYDNNPQHRRPRQFRERINHDFGDRTEKIQQRFRVDAEMHQFICDRLRPRLQQPTDCNMALTVEESASIGFRIMCDGGHQRALGDAHGPSQSTVSLHFHRFVNAVLAEFNDEIRFPANLADRQRIAQDFYSIAQFPCVVGAMDGTLIDIKKPHEFEEAYVDRRQHQHHSLNVLVVCDANMKVLYVNSRNPGRVHDAAVFNHSALAHALDTHPPLFPNAVIIADTAYGCTRHVVTPIRGNNLTPAQIAYNRSHKKTRCIIERCFGLAKERFRILKKMRYHPDFASDIVRCAFILHNLALRYQPPNEDDFVPEALTFQLGDEIVPNGPVNQARRREIVSHFAHLIAQGVL